MEKAEPMADTHLWGVCRERAVRAHNALICVPKGTIPIGRRLRVDLGAGRSFPGWRSARRAHERSRYRAWTSRALLLDNTWPPNISWSPSLRFTASWASIVAGKIADHLAWSEPVPLSAM